jgi:hypothetical protein
VPKHFVGKAARSVHDRAQKRRGTLVRHLTSANVREPRRGQEVGCVETSQSATYSAEENVFALPKFGGTPQWMIAVA